MKITIDLLLLLKIYLLGSLVSMLILTFSKELIRNKRNYLVAFLVSWVSLIIPYNFLRTKFLNFILDKLDLYIYSVINSFLYFRFKKRDILGIYFRRKYDSKKYHYADKLMSKHNYDYWYNYGTFLGSPFYYTEFRFINRYLRSDKK